MTDPAPHQRVLAAIEVKKAEAAMLLETVKHESLKTYARLAARDLDEALDWLNQGSVRVAALTVDIATQRLAMVKDALDAFGPDAIVMDMG
jgi:hypothetical protein